MFSLSKKVIAVIFIAIFVTFHLSADVNVYESATAKTAAVISEVDGLISQRKYKTAFDVLQAAESDEFIICKQVEVCTNYFVRSLLHQLFAFKDLEDNESLDDLRMNGGELDLVLFDPAKVIAEYEANHGTFPILEKALGDYYYDVSLRYGENWFIKGNELVAKVIEHYEKADAGMEMDAASYGHFGESYSKIGDYEKAIRFMEKSIELGYESADIHFNLALAHLHSGNYEKALQKAEYVAANFSDAAYKVDSLVMVSELSNMLGDAGRAIDCLETAKKLAIDYYLIYQKLLSLYLQENKIKDADANADYLFSLAPENPAAGQMVLDGYLKYGKTDELKNFFERNLKKYKKQNLALANLYFFYLDLSLELGDAGDVKKYANLAKKYFEKGGAYSEDVQMVLQPYL